jgi:CheY-like chemotaxis protein
MPDMDGFEVLEWLSRAPEFALLPVIVLSGSSLNRDQQRATKLGARAYYIKALEFADTEEMLRTISRDWLDGRSPAPPH